MNKLSRVYKIVLSFLIPLSIEWGVIPVNAQSPFNWQDDAVGLRSDQNTDHKTGGLGFNVYARDWPSISLRGGVEAADSYNGSFLQGPIGIDLGQIKINGYSGLLSNEVADWAHDELTYTYGGTYQMKLWVSRLSPAILIQSSSTVLTLLTGNVSGNVFNGSSVTPRPNSPSFPKYLAYFKGGQIQIQNLSSTEKSLSGMDQNWLLLWYGNNSPFVDTKYPLTYEWTIPQHDAHQADTPLLFVFQNPPTSIKQSSGGGVDINFSGSAGYVALLPLFGRDILQAVNTESWSQGLPQQISNKAKWWADHLCSYPQSVSETYFYNPGLDSVVITESFNFLSICTGGTQFAPIPPFLSIVKDSLGVVFSGIIADGDLNTEFGPSLGIEKTQQYTWKVTGLKKYTDAKQISLNVSDLLPEEKSLEQELVSETQKIIGAGHFAPWIFIDNIPIGPNAGDLYWANPADTLYHLIDVADVLTGTIKNNLINYLISERTNYPPETIYNLDIFSGSWDNPIVNGAPRQGYAYYGGNVEWFWDRGIPDSSGCRDCRGDAVLKKVPIYSFYSLARYYDLINATPVANVWTIAKSVMDRDMHEQDWATFYWFNGFDERPTAVQNANRFFAGLVGYIRMARMVNDPASEGLARALLAKAAVLRIALVEYPRYLYTADLVELPPEDNWQPAYNHRDFIGYLYNYHWSGPYDDARQVVTLNQFQVYLNDRSGGSTNNLGDYTGEVFFQRQNAHFVAYQDLVPELGRLLSEHARQDSDIFIDKVEAIFPNWYEAFAEANLGAEHNLSHPIDSFQLFMAKAWIEQEKPDKLAKYLDIPWLWEGDLFYLQKLAETIKAYKNVVWDDSLLLRGTPRNGTIYLSWEFYKTLPQNISWQIEYNGPAGDQPSPITGIPGSIARYQLTGLTNGAKYTIVLTALSNNTVLLISNPITVIPASNFSFLPSAMK